MEKAAKAFLTWHGQVFRKTHSLVELGEACAALDATLEPLLRSSAPLTQYAWRFRYPGEPDEPPAQEADSALSTAKAADNAIVSRLPKDTQP